MKTASLILGIIFTILTFVGCVYVIINHGQVNAGHAIVPAFWTIVFLRYYRSGKRK